MFGTEKKFTTFDYYKKTGIRIHGQHINNLESCGLIRKIAVRNKGKDYPRGGIYIIPSRALTTIEKYNFREAMA